MIENELIENHQRYLEWAELYRKFGYDVNDERAFIINKSQPIAGNILEIGTGKGYFTLALARAGFNFFSFDISEVEQRYALLNLMYYGLQQHVTFGVADVECIPCDDGFFDVIFAVNMIYHLFSIHKICDEFIRILSSNGKIVLSDFNKKGLEILDKIHSVEGRQHEVSGGTLNEASAVLTNRGFKLKEYHSETQDLIVASPIMN
ncbi:MAG: methyltransferase domain-containing protein [Syntrophaceae bacterium]|nr:methyltransferase domain-containing protein [Syntrophaceae bacterium]